MSSAREHILRQPGIATQVRRYHTWPTLTQQTIGDHIGNSLRIYLALYGEIKTDAAQYIAYHDLGELVVGDPPFPVKVRNPDFKVAHEAVEVQALARMGLELPELSQQERLRLKIVDLLDMFEFGLRERHMGNKFAKPIVGDTYQTINTLVERLASQHDQRQVVAYLGATLHFYGELDACDQG